MWNSANEIGREKAVGEYVFVYRGNDLSLVMLREIKKIGGSTGLSTGVLCASDRKIRLRSAGSAFKLKT